MNDILALTFEVQLMLVCGYFSYSIGSIGRRINHSVEDKIFQIITFGFLSLIIYQTLIWLCDAVFESFSNTAETIFQAASMILIAVGIGAIWKAKLQSWVYKIMKALGVSNEDHYPTVLGSVIHGHTKFTWDYLHLHLKDGRTIRSDLTQIKDLNLAGSAPLVDAEGNVALYVTTIYRSDDTQEDFVPAHENGSSKLSYYPKDAIAGIEIAWRKPT